MVRRVVQGPAIVLLLLLCLISPLRAERETIDKIAAVVGDEVILTSELAGQIQMAAFQMTDRPETEEEMVAFQKRILEEMISERLFLMEAKKDTSISVRREEVEQALEEHIARIAGNFDSHDAFLEALAAEGMTLRDLERQYYKDVENNLLKQKYIQSKLYGVSVSRYEVEQFYEKFKDSIPRQPEAVKLAHILLQVRPAQAIEDSVASLAAELRQQVLDGADFATVSAQHSSFGAGANGGDLGYVERDDVVPEFARAAFRLSKGDISGVVRTEFGYHVIKCEGKRGSKLRLRHILLGVQPSAQDTASTMQLADSLMNEIRGGADFGELAKTFSSDDDSRAQGGELGWFATDKLPTDFVETVVGWKTPGELRGPIKTRFGIHILKLLDYQPEKRLNLEDDYDNVKELARQDKTGRIVDDWIAEIKAKTYLDYRLEELK